MTHGKLIGDFTVAKADDERFYIFGSGPAEDYHMRWFEAHLPKDGSVKVRPLTIELTGLSIAGPKSRELFSRLTDQDVSTEALPFMAFREMDIGLVPAKIGRVCSPAISAMRSGSAPTTCSPCMTRSSRREAIWGLPTSGAGR